MPKKKEPTEAAAKETKTTAAQTSKTAAAAAPAKTAKPEPAAAPKTAKPATKVEKPSVASSAPTTTAKATKPATKAPAKAEKPATEANPIITVIVAKFDVGPGNNLYIRGDGHSLSWESGTLMENVGGDTWQWTTTEAREGVLGFKLLINDEVWSIGENMNTPFGETTTFYPAF